MVQRNSEARKTYMEMRRKEHLSRETEFIPVPTGSKPHQTQSRKHFRTTVKALKDSNP